MKRFLTTGFVVVSIGLVSGCSSTEVSPDPRVNNIAFEMSDTAAGTYTYEWVVQADDQVFLINQDADESSNVRTANVSEGSYAQAQAILEEFEFEALLETCAKYKESVVESSNATFEGVVSTQDGEVKSVLSSCALSADSIKDYNEKYKAMHAAIRNLVQAGIQ